VRQCQLLHMSDLVDIRERWTCCVGERGGLAIIERGERARLATISRPPPSHSLAQPSAAKHSSALALPYSSSASRVRYDGLRRCGCKHDGLRRCGCKYRPSLRLSSD
jgi:hypothetical protein